MNAAQLHIVHRNYNAAREILDEINIANLNDSLKARYYFLLANIYYSEQNYSQARQLYQHVLNNTAASEYQINCSRERIERINN